MTNQKFCKDCKWYETTIISPKRCLHPSLAEVDLVTGENDPPFCNMERDSFYRSSKCKEEGLLWEQKPWWKVL